MGLTEEGARRIRHLIVLLFAASVFFPRLAAADSVSDWSESAEGRVRLISAVTAVGLAPTVEMGLQFDLKPGWKIYWRSPGDAGYPPSIDWQGSDNLADAQMSWPAPRRFDVSGIETMGYQDEVVLPLVIRLNDPGKPLSLHAAVDYLTCAVICVPRHADLSLSLLAGPAEAGSEAHAIGRFLARVPGEGKRDGLALAEASAGEDGRLTVVVTAATTFTHPDLFVEREDQMQFGRPQIRLESRGKRAVFLVTPIADTGQGSLLDKPLTLTVVDGNRSMEVVTDVTPPRGHVSVGDLTLMLAVALLGGLILNIMPCVLPVLSLKILAVIDHGGGQRRDVRAGFLASAAGILVSFVVLAVATAVAKMVGAAVGWGIQFQQPVFLAFLIAVVTLFAGNLAGFFEIPVPAWVSDLGAGGTDGRLAGQFASGVFATLLATPCSAPFLGTAVGFALARGPFQILLIFSFLGLGMAAPYLAVAAWPQLARALPKPGRWMVTAKRVLSALLVATVIWLLVVMGSLAGLAVAAGVGGLMTVLLVLLAYGRRIGAVARAMASAALLVAALGLAGEGGAVAARPAPTAGLWKPFDRGAIAAAVAAGNVVFVDVTAEWCITCQVNKAAVVYRDPVLKRLNGPKTIAMQADWTRPDDGIADYLASFGRYGVPFDAVYGPGAPDGIALPELLTTEDVIDAVNKAAAPPS